MLLHWGAEYLENVLASNLKERIKEIRCDPRLERLGNIPPIPFINAGTGETMAQIPMAGNRISRRKLRKFLTEGENLNIQAGHAQPLRNL